MIYQTEINLQTSGHDDIHNITDEVAEAVRRSKIHRGIVNVFNVGSTGSIATMEYEPGLARDVPETLDRLIPPGRQYGHEQAWHDGNGHSHLQATLLGPSMTVPVVERRLALGQWQQIVHLEGDIKPRSRTLVVTVNGEA